MPENSPPANEYRELFGRMTEEYRKGNDEMVKTRGEVHELSAEVHSLTTRFDHFQEVITEAVQALSKAVQGNGEKGLIRQMDSVQNKVERSLSEISKIREEGSGYSQRRWMSVRVRVARNTHAVEELRARMDRADKKRFQLWIAVFAAIAVLGAEMIARNIAFVTGK